MEETQRELVSLDQNCASANLPVFYCSHLAVVRIAIILCTIQLLSKVINQGLHLFPKL